MEPAGMSGKRCATRSCPLSPTNRPFCRTRGWSEDWAGNAGGKSDADILPTRESGLLLG